MDEAGVATFLSGQPTKALQKWKNRIEEWIKEKQDVKLNEERIQTFRLYYEKYKSPLDPEFDPLYVRSRARPDDGFDGTYMDAVGNMLEVKKHLTWRMNDYDMFTEIRGRIGSREIKKLI